MHDPKHEVTIGLVGKYIDLPDAYLSVTEALRAGGFAHQSRVRIRWVKSDDCETRDGAARNLGDLDGIVVPGGFGVRGIEGKLGALRFARENAIPVLGLCLGLQCMVIEYARDVAGLPGASSTEFDPDTEYPVIATMAEQVDIIDHGDLGGTMRLGLYDVAKEKTAGVTPAPIGDQAVAAVLSGGVASFLACPVEVSLCRMQADGALPAAQRRGYAHVGDALASIARTEGAAQLFAGAAPTVARAAVVSVSQLVSYDQAKQWLGPTGVGGLREGVGLHLAASLVAGFTYSFASLPLDTAKTRMQTQVADARTGALPYVSLAGTLGTIARREGAASLWRGFGPYFLRGGGHTVAMLLFKEQFTAAARRYQASHEGEAYYTYTP